MDWHERMNQAMDYIEAHLTDEISYDRLAQIACCSTYHFQRMFSFITEVPLSEYIRRRRLTKAAFELQAGGVKVIDAALKYGYETPEAFSRAFKNLHGVMPTASRSPGVALKAYPRISFSISIKGDVEMRYRIEKREVFRVFGATTTISTDHEKAFEQVPQFFRKCDEDGSTDEINRLLGRFPDNCTISGLYDFTDSEFTYMLGQFLPEHLDVPARFATLVVPERTWAIFDVEGREMQSMWRRIWSEWFPSSDYETVEGPQFEMYYGLARHTNGYGEIWIPVRHKD